MSFIDPEFVRKSAAEVAAMWEKYLQTFEIGDRVLKNQLHYINIYDAEIGELLPREKIKGIFIGPYRTIGCYILWEGNEKPELCPVSIIKHDN